MYYRFPRNYIRIVCNLIYFSLFSILIIAPIYAANPALEQTYDQVCGNKFNNTADPNYDSNYKIFYQDLYNAQRYDQLNSQTKNGNLPGTSDLTQAGCPPSLNDISLIVLRVIVLIITFFGGYLFFILVRSAIDVMTAGPNKDKAKRGKAGFQSVGIGAFILAISYSLIIFIALRLGLSGNPDEFSFFDGTRLIFRFIFEY
jgi:hypothetical protein